MLKAATLPALLCENAQIRGRAIAIREKHLGIWQEITWTQYLGHVRRFSLGLVALGLARGDVVAVQAENCQEWLYSDLAIQCAGGVVATVYPTSAVDEVAHILKDSGARFVIVGDQEHLDKVLAVMERGIDIERVIVIDAKGCKHYPEERVMRFKDVEACGHRLASAEPQRFDSLVAAVSENDVYDIMYTSGTSGLPKGALCTQWGALEGARTMLAAVPIGADDSWLSYLPLSHAFERIMSLAVHLLTGYVVNFADSIDTVQADVAEIQPTVFGAVPRILEKMKTSIDIRIGKTTKFKRAVYKTALAAALARVARQRVSLAQCKKAVTEQTVGFDDVRPITTPWRFIDRLLYFLVYVAVFRQLRKQIGLLGARFVVCGAAPMSDELFEYYRALGIPIVNGFGMTELHNIPFLCRPEHYVRGTAGHIMPGWQMKIAADGELLLKGPIGFAGYKGNEAESLRTFDGEKWLHTGDLVDVYENGYVAIVGRKKDVLITSGGKNISPELIENRLKTSRYISEAIVIGDGRHYVTALIEIDGDAVGDHLQAKGIAYTTLRDMASNGEVLRLIQGEIDEVNASLAQVETVKKFAIIPRDLSHDDGEMTPTRKVKRAKIEKMFGEMIEAMY